jgi:predicted PhzF superfamily epimerase YddE/YHI9
LWEENLVSEHEEISFSTMSGVLRARKSDASIELDFPARIVEPTGNERSINEALGKAPLATSTYTTPKGTVYLLEFETEATVRALEPDFKRLAETPARAVIVTAVSGTPEQDFISRYFAPAVGIDEDPVTGSAHCCLAPYWSARLGKSSLTGYQASRRGGFVKCKYAGERVYIQGSAITLFKTVLDTRDT